MVRFQHIFSVSLLLAISACGGGGSSSGGSNAFSGVYEGGGDVTFTVGSTSEVNFTSARIVIANNGDVQASDGSGDFTTTGRLNGNRFTTSGNLSFNEDGVNCNINMTYTGTVTDQRVTGTVSGDGTCNGLAASNRGNYEAARTSNAAQRSGSSLKDTLSNLN